MTARDALDELYKLPAVVDVAMPDDGPESVVLVDSKLVIIIGVNVNLPDGKVIETDELAATVALPVRIEKAIGRAVPVTLFTIWFG